MNNPRERILYTALELFATQGFAKTSTRQISEAAKVNLSSIKYYFGDKQGLYEAAFNEPMSKEKSKDTYNFFKEVSIEEGMKNFFINFLSPLSQNQNIQLCVKLHMREVLEPTGLRDSEIDNDIKPHHDALIKVLMKEFKLQNKDNALDRLAFSIVSMAIFLYMAHDIIVKINSNLVEGEAALNEWANTMSTYALAMIETEKKKRNEKL